MMLASHRFSPFVHANDTMANQFWPSMGLALIEATEHVLATAKRFLRSAPRSDPHAVRVRLLTTGAPARRMARAAAESAHLGGLCEEVVGNEW